MLCGNKLAIICTPEGSRKGIVYRDTKRTASQAGTDQYIPVIATDRSGCRETVDAGTTGYLIPVKDENALVQALEDFLSLTWKERAELGHAGRRKMEDEFDRQIVVQKYLDALEDSQVSLCEVKG